MNFSELFEQAQLVDPTDTIHVTVGVWRYHFPDRPTLRNSKLEWGIYSARLSNHFQSSEPETALELYRIAFKEAHEVRDLSKDLATVDAGL